MSRRTIVTLALALTAALLTLVGLGGRQVDLEGRALEAFTAKHRGERVAFLLDGMPLAAPVVRSPVRWEAVIDGSFTDLGESLSGEPRARGAPRVESPLP